MNQNKSSKISPSGLIFSLVLICIVFFFMKVDIWHDYFDIQSPLYIIYNILRVVFLLLLAIMIFAAGRPLIRFYNAENRIDRLDSLDLYLVSSISGIALINILVFFLGVISLIRVEATLLIAVVLTYMGGKYFQEIKDIIKQSFSDVINAIRNDSGAFSDRVTPTLIKIINYILLLAIFLSSVVILIKRGLFLYVADNDIPGSYIPRYNEIINITHGFFPSFRFIHYYTAKGIGLQFFGMSLSDAISSQLVNFYLLALCVIILIQLLRRVSSSALLISACVLLFLHAPLAEFPLSKNHVPIAAYFIFMFYLVQTSLTKDTSISQSISKVLFALAVSSVIALPMNAVLIVALSMFAILLSILLQNPKNTQQFLLVAVIAILSLVSIYTFNYLQTGLVDMATSVFDRYIDMERYNSWSNIIALKMQRFLNRNEGYFSITSLLSIQTLNEKLKFATGLFNSEYFYAKAKYSYEAHIPRMINEGLISLFSFALFLVLIVIKSAKREMFHFLKSETGIMTFLSGAIFLLSQVIIVTYFHDAAERATLFRGFFFLLFTVSILIEFTKLLIAKKHRSIIYIVLPMIITMALFIPKPKTAENRNMSNALSFLSGSMSYAEIANQAFPIQRELAVSHRLPPGESILHLNFSPGAYIIPTTEFTRPIQNRYLRDIDKVLFGSPDEAIAALKKNGIEFIYIDLDIRNLTITALAPLFKPESISNNFRVVWSPDWQNAFLFTLRKDIGVPIPPDFPLLETIRSAIKQNIDPNHYVLYEYGMMLYYSSKDSAPVPSGDIWRSH